MSLTRRDLRRKIAGDMRDILVVVAESGSDNTVVDSVELGNFDNTLVSSQIMCTEAADPLNLGHVARVSGSSQAGYNVTFDPPLPVPLTPGDEFELVNLQGTGFRFQEYHRQIEGIVKEVARSYPWRDNSPPERFSWENPVLTPPDHWMAMYGLTIINDDNGLDMAVKPARSEGARGWHCDASTRTVTISGTDLSVAAERDVILHGLMPHPLLTDDDSECRIDGEWITLTASYKLAQRRGDREWNQWAIEWARMAAGERPARLFRYPANTVMLEEV